MTSPLKMGLAFDGFEALAEVLEQLPELMQQNVLDGAANEGAKAIEVEWKIRAPSYRLTFTKVRSGRAARRQLARIKARTGADYSIAYGVGLALVGHQKPYHALAHLFEFGTAPRVQYTTGRKTGEMMATPFMRPGVEAAVTAAFHASADHMSRGLAREARKLAR